MYILGQFPYPSGNIHMGHVRVYTICDVLTRYYRLKGKQVINPMGWDSFGLPAENAAIQRQVHPKKWTAANIAEMKAQLLRMGFSFDWDKELATHQPEYYKHTQEIFSLLYQKGLAYKKDAYVNWDPVDHTVLANEQIDANGRSWRSGAIVEQKLLKQWFLNIRSYAEEMLAGLDKLDKWNPIVKEMQKGWIGKSIGAELTFLVKSTRNSLTLPLKIFTTRPDTIYGATFVAIAHDNPVIEEILKTDPENWIDQNAYERYKEQVRLSGIKDQSAINMEPGLQLQGFKALHPITHQELPVYLTTYVLKDYGTGAIMGVPYHDQRDCAFALQNGIEMVQVIEGDEENHLESCTLVNSGHFNGMKVPQAVDQIIQSLETEGKAKKVTNYRLRDWLVSRQRYWGVPIPIVFCDTCGEVPLKSDNGGLPLILPEGNNEKDLEFLKKGHPLSHFKEFVECNCPKCNQPGAKREVDTLDTFVDSSWYFLRFLDSQNSDDIFNIEKFKNWMPVDIYVGGMEHAIMHLLYARFIHKFLCDVKGIKHSVQYKTFNMLREPFKELIVQGLVKGKTYKLKANGKYLFPEDIPNYTSSDYDVSFEKMSKSKGNGIAPDSMAEKYGVDTLRLALLFSGPPESDLNFEENFLVSMKQFLDRIAKLGENLAQNSSFQQIESRDTLLAKHKEKLIPLYKLLQEYEMKIHNNRFFHVAIARLMELNNLLTKMTNDPEVQLIGFTYLIQALYPFVPHLTSELWSELERELQILTKLGLNKDISQQRFDDMDLMLNQNNAFAQLNIFMDGKHLGTIDMPKEYIGDPEKIYNYILEKKPKEVKRLDVLLKKSIVEFNRVISPKDKPLINLITKK